MRYGGDYIFQKGVPILLYGAATTGAILYSNLTAHGFSVHGFIDQRADEIDSYYGLPVWDAGTAGRYASAHDAIVVIAIKNVFEHERVAAGLWRAGCRRIVFRPYRSVCGEETERDHLLNAVYDQLLGGNCADLPACPEVAGPERQVLRDRSVLLDQGGYVTVNIPAPYVFSDKYADPAIPWSDIPCLGLLPHLALFDLYNGTWNPDCAEYMKYCRRAAEKSGGIVTSKAWEASVYQNRLDIFNHMQYSWEHDQGFFVRNAVEGRYNPKGYFNIRSGKHRMTYLLVKGRRYLPLRIKKADHEAWRRREQAEQIMEVLWESQQETLPIALGNPYLYDRAGDNSAFYERILFSLLNGLYRDALHTGKPLSFKKKTVLFHHTPMALYADIFRMLGFDVFLYESDPLQKKLSDAVLSHVPFCRLESLEEGPGTYDLAIREEPFSAGSAAARIAITICGQARENGLLITCGMANGQMRYAYSNITLK